VTNDELAAEIAKLRADLQQLVGLCSDQFGRNGAIEAALLGMLRVVGGLAPVRESVDHHLEKSQAHDLGSSLNQTAVDSFDDAADLIRSAMREAAESSGSGDQGMP
jgi:hypothetical protein